MGKKQTALMQAIEKLKDRHNFYVGAMGKDTYTDIERMLLYIKSIALGEAIKDISELLPIEAHQLSCAVCQGWAYDLETKGMIPLDDYRDKYLLEEYGINYQQMLKEAYNEN